MRGSVIEITLSSQVPVNEDTSLPRANLELKKNLVYQIGVGEYASGALNWGTYHTEFHPNPENNMIGTLYGEVNAIVRAEGIEEESKTLEYTHADLWDLAEAIHQNAVKKGFWSDAPAPGTEWELVYVGNKLALIHSEVSEALEELREKGVDALYGAGVHYYGPNGKPEGFASELADIIIRVLDLAGALGIGLHEVVAEKIEYNAGRPAKHGKAF